MDYGLPKIYQVVLKNKNKIILHISIGIEWTTYVFGENYPLNNN